MLCNIMEQLAPCVMDRWYWWRTRRNRYAEQPSGLLVPVPTISPFYSAVSADSMRRSTLEYVCMDVVWQQTSCLRSVSARLLHLLLVLVATDLPVMYTQLAIHGVMHSTLLEWNMQNIWPSGTQLIRRRSLLRSPAREEHAWLLWTAIDVIWQSSLAILHSCLLWLRQRALLRTTSSLASQPCPNVCKVVELGWLWSLTALWTQM